MPDLVSKDTPLSVRRQRLGIARMNPLVFSSLNKKQRRLAPEVMDYLARSPGMDAASAARYVEPYGYDQLESAVLPRFYQLKDFEASAQRLAAAVEAGESIGISGDYDCDGNCSTALMIRFLQSSGVPPQRIHVHIPNRKREGYGVNRNAVAAMDGKHVSLLLTLDNGTLAHAPLADAATHCMATIVIDHHPNSSDHPVAPGLVVNPKRSDEPLQHDTDGVADLAAVGVTWMICRRATQLLAAKKEHASASYYETHSLTPPDPRDWLGLVTLATVGDVVNIATPLNRALVSEGLKVIREGRDAHIATLAKVAQLPELARFSEEDISFRLAPIINAPGRLGQSVAWAFLSPANATSQTVDTLLADATIENAELRENLRLQQQNLVKLRFIEANKANDRAIARVLDTPPANPSNILQAPIDIIQYGLMLMSQEANQLRKTVEAAVLRQARPQARQWLAQHPDSRSLLLAGEGWHEGVVGIVAGRLKEEFNLPTMVASIDATTGMGKASARSVKVAGHPIDIGQALRDLCEKEKLLAKAGGHPMAAGCSFEAKNLDSIRSRLEYTIGGVTADALAAQRGLLAGALDMSTVLPDGCKPAEALRQWKNSQEALRPYGEGAAKPRLGLYNLRISNVHHSRDGKHIFFDIRSADPTIETIRGSAFHAVGTALEKALHDAARAPDGTCFLLTGGLDAAAAGDSRGERPPLHFQLDDMLVMPQPVSLSAKATIAQALDCRQQDIVGVFATKSRMQSR